MMRLRDTCVIGVMVFAAATVTWATIPGAGGVIKGCYQKQKGLLRIVDAFSQCSTAENTISWSQTGPPGAVGPQGPTGTRRFTGPCRAARCGGTTGTCRSTRVCDGQLSFGTRYRLRTGVL
jgi:hypothetical protein